MGHYKSHCPESPRNKGRDRDQANIVNKAPRKKSKIEESEVNDLHYYILSLSYPS